MAEVRAIEFDDALISLRGLLGAELQVIVNFYGTMLDEDGFLGFHLPREVEISIQRKRG